MRERSNKGVVEAATARAQFAPLTDPKRQPADKQSLRRSAVAPAIAGAKASRCEGESGPPQPLSPINRPSPIERSTASIDTAAISTSSAETAETVASRFHSIYW